LGVNIGQPLSLFPKQKRPFGPNVLKIHAKINTPISTLNVFQTGRINEPGSRMRIEKYAI